MINLVKIINFVYKNKFVEGFELWKYKTKMDYAGTYAVEATELSEDSRILLCELDNSLIAHGVSECDAKLSLLKRVR